MEEFFIKIINALPILLVALPAGWLGSMAQSYFSEKGKNLATKEDIQEITAKIEFVKSQFNKKHLRSKAYIERQIRAYDEICHQLNEIKKTSYKANGKIEFIKEHDHKYSKAKYTSARSLLDKLDEHLIFLSAEVCGAITEVFSALSEFSETEYSASLLTDAEERRGAVIIAWNIVEDLVEDAQFQIRRELTDE
jgi:hypothetical protein